MYPERQLTGKRRDVGNWPRSANSCLIGWLSVGSRASGARSLAALKDGLAAQGWNDGSQIVIEERYADGQHDRLASFTQELAAKKPALGLVVLPGALLTSERRRILKIALAQRWPVVAGLGAFAGRIPVSTNQVH